MWFLNDNFCHIHIDTKDKTAKKLAQYKNTKEFQNVFALLYNETFAHIPDIERLPDTVSQRIIKESIIWKAGVFFFRNNGSTLSLPGSPTGDFTLYAMTARRVKSRQSVTMLSGTVPLSRALTSLARSRPSARMSSGTVSI